MITDAPVTYAGLTTFMTDTQTILRLLRTTNIIHLELLGGKLNFDLTFFVKKILFLKNLKNLLISKYCSLFLKVKKIKLRRDG